jgi:phosphatidylserine decarboxylase
MSHERTGFGDRLFVGMQYLLPQHLLTRGVHVLARVRARPVKDLAIRAFLAHYPINLAEAENPDPRAYESFNAFFTRALKPGARPVDPAPEAIVSPVDGAVMQAGPIDRDTLVQAKGLQYSAAALLGDDDRLAAEFAGGDFATIYLAPYDYHRIHMPFAGTLRLARFVPGDLFSVNAVTAASVPGLFARNERIACVFDTPAGPLAVVLVGALFVGSMGLSWTGDIVARPGRGMFDIDSGGRQVVLGKAAELGRVNMGSTVILLFPRGFARPGERLAPGTSVRMGERIAVLAR